LLDDLHADAVLLRPDRVVAATSHTADLRAWQRQLRSAGIAPTTKEDDQMTESTRPEATS
jgi:3-(3-hydroxy-phenyl)propionate hydroxylase